MKLCSVYAWVCYTFCHFTPGKAIHSQSAMRMVKPGYKSPGSLLQGFLCLPTHPDPPSLTPATVFQSLSWEELFPEPIPFSAISPSLPPGILRSCSASQLNFWASPLPFPNKTGKSTSTTNQHCLIGSSEHLCSAEKDPKIAVIDLKELETDVMLHHLSYAR